MPIVAPQQDKLDMPRSLGALLDKLEVVTKQQVATLGWSSDCGENAHDFRRWLTGFYRPPVPPHIAAAFRGVTPSPIALVLLRCRNCETVEVRDHTFDRIVDGRKTIASGRRDGFLCWYAGARRNQRTYL